MKAMRPNIICRFILRFSLMISPIAWADPAESLSGVAALGELNCTACHSPSETQVAWLTPKAAPKLDHLGERISAEWLQSYLASPQSVTPGTTMPDLLHGNAEQAEALTHYLLSGGQAEFRRTMPDKAAVARGQSLYHRVGCVACHEPQDGSPIPPNSVPLPIMEQKWSFGGLKKFLIDPQSTRPTGRMPAMHLTEDEAADVTHYLLRKTKLSASAEVTFYRGRIRSLAALDTAEITRTAPAPGLELSSSMKESGKATRITTWITIKKGGEYTFYLKANEASRLSIGGRWSLGEDSWETRKVDDHYDLDMAPGTYEIKLDFVRRGQDEPILAVDWKGPGFDRETIPAAVLNKDRDPVTTATREAQTFHANPAKTEEGRVLYNTLNCATCHEGRQPLNQMTGLNGMDTTRGCLADYNSSRTPDFHLDVLMRDSIRKEITSSRTGPPSPQQRLTLAMTTFRCTSCHVRDGVGGVSPERSVFFTANVDDLGDQGRIPPNLNGVGDKLRPEWLAKVITEGAGVRPYLNTRMPSFGITNVGHLSDIFVRLDRNSQAAPPMNDTPEERRVAGRKIVGTDGLSCIACHRFNRQPAHSMQVLDLTNLTGRLNEDWFRRFLRDPDTFQAGTRMPSLWPNGHTLLPTVLDGDTDRQHAALWSYLSDGTNARSPEGLSRKNLEIIVGGEAVVYRGKLWEAGFRAIAAGYPGQLNAAFDSEEMRLAYIWRGRFLDTSTHWTNQGMGLVKPLGSDVALFPHGSPLALLPEKDSPWPTETSKAMGMRFSGYQLDTLRRPTLIYHFHEMDIKDFMSTSGESSLHRTIQFTSSKPNRLYFRIAKGPITSAGDHAWRLNELITIKFQNHVLPFLRGKGDQTELVVPIHFNEANHELEIDYAW